MTEVRVNISSTPIDVTGHEEFVARPQCGAVVSFAGVVRDHDHGRGVMCLEYSAHPSAEDVLARISALAVSRWELGGIAITHRIGELAIGEPAFIVAVSSAHRGDAFEACRWLVDEAKLQLPVWKRQQFTDGTSEWVNCP